MELQKKQSRSGGRKRGTDRGEGREERGFCARAFNWDEGNDSPPPLPLLLSGWAEGDDQMHANFNRMSTGNWKEKGRERRAQMKALVLSPLPLSGRAATTLHHQGRRRSLAVIPCISGSKFRSEEGERKIFSILC